VVHVLGEVEDYCGVGGLAGEAGASAAREDGGVELAADVDGGDDVGFIAGDDEADGNLPVVGGVGGVEGSGAGVEADFSADRCFECGFQGRGGREGLVGAGVRTGQDGEG